VVFLNTDDQASRVRLLLPQQKLEMMDEDDDDIFCKNITDRYQNQPAVLNDVFLLTVAASIVTKQRLLKVELIQWKGKQMLM